MPDATKIIVDDCALKDAGEIHALLRRAWMATYVPILGEDEAALHLRSLTRTRLRWSILTGWTGRKTSWLKAQVDGVVCGFAHATCDPSGIVLYMLYVDPAWHGRGVGSRLLAAVEAWKPNAKTIRLEVLEGNKRAIEWYRRRGFQSYGSNANLSSRNRHSSLFMDKELERVSEGRLRRPQVARRPARNAHSIIAP